ncbi:hexose carrier protein HEX6-like [Oryza sativa Japonica Group]|uniref:hexose carrier protein HEX6-like n=1 Tax=Oryza sativa subsp. japonica TaxID=39947 RepID=UPI0001C7D3A2
MILGGFAYIAGAAVSGASVNVSMAILSGALLSVGLGFTTQSVPLYMAEIAVARYRGAFSNGIQFSLCLGALAATTVNFTVEKTPNSLVQQGKDRDKVKALLQKIRGVDTVDDELDEIIAANAAAAQGENGLWLIL